MYMLDVAVGPVIVIFGLLLLFILAIVVVLVVFSVRAIRKIKTEVELRERDVKK